MEGPEKDEILTARHLDEATGMTIEAKEREEYFDLEKIKTYLENQVLDYCKCWLKWRTSLVIEGHLGLTLDDKDIIWIHLNHGSSSIKQDQSWKLLQSLDAASQTDLELFIPGVISYIQNLCNDQVKYKASITIQGLLAFILDQNSVVLVQIDEKDTCKISKTTNESTENLNATDPNQTIDLLETNEPNKTDDDQVENCEKRENKRKLEDSPKKNESEVKESPVKRSKRIKARADKRSLHQESTTKEENIRHNKKDSEGTTKSLVATKKENMKLDKGDKVDLEDKIKVQEETNIGQDMSQSEDTWSNRRSKSRRKTKALKIPKKKEIPKSVHKKSKTNECRLLKDKTQNTDVHTVKQKQPIDIQEVDPNIEIAKNQCSICLKKFSTHRYLKTHMAVHDKSSGYQCDICNKTYINLSHLNRHKLSHNERKPFECLMCGKGYIDERGLQVHLTTHTGAKREYYKCPEEGCDKKYLRKDVLMCHIRTHEGGLPYQCEHCSLKFRTKAELGSHRRAEHKDVRNYLCPKCPSAFTKKAKLDDHMAIHTKDRPHLCNICNAFFKTKTYLRVHMKKVHLQKSKHLCHTCGKEYKSKISLIAHTKMHQGDLQFACEFCTKKFAVKYRLIQHLKSHIRQQYVCGVCGYRFKEKQHLEKHQETHKEKNKENKVYLIKGEIENLQLSETGKCQYCFCDLDSIDNIEEHLKTCCTSKKLLLVVPKGDSLELVEGATITTQENKETITNDEDVKPVTVNNEITVSCVDNVSEEIPQKSECDNTVVTTDDVNTTTDNIVLQEAPENVEIVMTEAGSLGLQLSEALTTGSINVKPSNLVQYEQFQESSQEIQEIQIIQFLTDQLSNSQ